MYVQRREFDQLITTAVQSLDPIPLGPAYSTLPGSVVRTNLIHHRLKKKFAKPADSDTLRSQSSVHAMLEYDATGLVSFDPVRMEMDSKTRKVLYQARLDLHKAFKAFKVDFKNLAFPSGESYDSSGGDVSLLAKLRDVRHWKVTPACFDLFARAVYNTVALKRVARAHMRTYTRAEEISLYNKYKGTRDVGFHIFAEKLRSFVTLSYGSRLTTVPKDKDVDRVIEVECMGNMIVQRTIGNGFRKVLLHTFGINLEMAQDVHKGLIAHNQYATIDLKNASNSNWMAVIKFLYPGHITDLLLASRAAVVSYKGDYFGLNMLSPMGNGFTFEVMTTTLLALARQLTSSSWVYGDDIIIDNDHALSYVDVLRVCGYLINESKTYINSPFRESCGAFYHDEVGYITCYDLHYPENDYDRMIIANKLWRLKEWSPACAKLHADALVLFDSLALRSVGSLTSHDICSNNFLDKGVICSKSQHKKRVSSKPTSYVNALKRLRESSRYKDVLKDLQVASSQFCMIPEIRTTRYKSFPLHLYRKDKWCWAAFYLRNGVIAPSIRQTHELKRIRVITSSYLVL